MLGTGRATIPDHPEDAGGELVFQSNELGEGAVWAWPEELELTREVRERVAGRWREVGL